MACHVIPLNPTRLYGPTLLQYTPVAMMPTTTAARSSEANVDTGRRRHLRSPTRTFHTFHQKMTTTARLLAAWTSAR